MQTKKATLGTCARFAERSAMCKTRLVPEKSTHPVNLPSKNTHRTQPEYTLNSAIDI